MFERHLSVCHMARLSEDMGILAINDLRENYIFLLACTQSAILGFSQAKREVA